MIARFLRSGWRRKKEKAYRRTPVSSRDPVYLLNKDSSASQSVFIIPGIGGNILPYKRMAKFLSQDFRVKGIFFPFWVNGQPGYGSVESFAEYFLGHIKQDCEDHVRILGYSVGGVIAFEVARRMQASGHKVSLVLFDTECPALEVAFGTFRGRMRHWGKHCEYSVRRIKYGINGNLNSYADVKLKIAVRRYTPKFLNMPVVLIRPGEISKKSDQRFAADLGWINVVKDLNVVPTAGRHGNAYKKQNADVFAQVLKDGLDWLKHQND